MRMAVCDDDEVFLMQFKSNVEEIFQQSGWVCEIDTYAQGKHLVQCVKDKVYDAIFLDIDMPEMDGFTVAEKIGSISENTLIVFCTSHNELVYDSFSYQPFWFLCKDNYVTILYTVLDKIRIRVSQIHQEIEFNINQKNHWIEAKKIIYIDVSKHKLCIHMQLEQELSLRGKIRDMEKKTDVFGFVKINSGTIVNMAWIKHIYVSAVVLKNGITLPLSRGKGVTIQRRFNEYMRGGR